MAGKWKSQDVVDSLKITGASATCGGGGGGGGGGGASASAPAKPRVDQDKYCMNFQGVGLCLLINNKNFDPKTGMSVRNGTEIDGDSVTKTFTALGYKMMAFNDLTVQKMKEKLENVAQMDHSNYASFVCVILSHGEEGVIFGTDNCEKLDFLTAFFKGNNCKSLVGKPKLFFIQACRGSKLDDGVDTVDNPGQNTVRIPVEADFLYAHSTAPGYYSWRNQQNGSWFIQALCETLDQHCDLELLQILTRVNRRVAYDFQSSTLDASFHNKKEIPCIVSMLTKEFYFP